MKKLLLIAVLLLALVVTFVACTNEKPEEPTDTETDVVTDPGTDDGTETDAPTDPDTETETDPATETETETTKDTEPPAKDTETETEPETADPNVPVFMITPEDLVSSQGLYDMAAPVLSEDGSYVTITPTGSDPYCYPFGNPTSITGSRYVVIKYRTSIAEGMDIQVYMGSGTLASDNDMIQTGIIADGEWQLAILDASLIDGQTSDQTGGGSGGAPAGYYDGEYVAFFRFDPMNCAYILDENGLPYKLEDGSNWARHEKPEGAYIDIAYIAFFSTEEGAKTYEYGESNDCTTDFTSDGAAQADGTLFTDSDLMEIFQIADPTGGAPAISGGIYNLPASFIHLLTTADGEYAYTADIQSTSSPGMSGMFVRGYAAACHEGSYYGVLSAENFNAFGGPGIYLNVNRNPADNSMKLRIEVRVLNLENGMISTKVYEQYIDSSVITAADDGETVSILAGGKLIATIAISGEQVAYTNTYMGGGTTEIPAGALATTAVVTLADGTVETIENAAVAATCASDIGMAVRTAALSFASVSVKPFSTVTIPEEFTKIEAPVVDPNAPVAVYTPDILAGASSNGIASAEIVENEGEDAYLHITPDFAKEPYDPWMSIFVAQDNFPYIAFTYRTNTVSGGQFFVGYGAGPSGPDTINVEWIGDGEWHTMIINFNDYEHIVKKDGKINYLRSDFLITKSDSDYFDIKNVAVFDSAEKAAAYYAPKFEYDAPAWDGDKAVVTHLSFDELRDGGNGIFAAGQSAGWDKVANVTTAVTQLQYWGWIGAKAETLGQFGYQIDKNEAKFDAAWSVAAEQGVIDAAAGTGAASASRMLINIDLTGLTGKHVVNVFYKDADGNMVTLTSFVLNVEEPAAPKFDMDTLDKTLVENWGSVSGSPSYGVGHLTTENGVLSIGNDAHEHGFFECYQVKGGMMDGNSVITGVNYYIFTIEGNKSDAAFNFQGCSPSQGNNFLLGSIEGVDVYLVDAEGNITVAEVVDKSAAGMNGRYGYLIPKDFTGYMVVPTAAICPWSDFNTSLFTDPATADVSMLGFYIAGVGNTDVELKIGSVYTAVDFPA